MNFFNVEALAFDAGTNRLYGVSDGDALILIDPATGSGSTVAGTGPVCLR